jgi:hypothetical protein
LHAAHPFLIKIGFPFSPDRVLTSPNQYRTGGVKWGWLQPGAGPTFLSAAAGENICPTNEIEKPVRFNSYLMIFRVG